MQRGETQSPAQVQLTRQDDDTLHPKLPDFVKTLPQSSSQAAVLPSHSPSQAARLCENIMLKNVITGHLPGMKSILPNLISALFPVLIL